MSRRPEPRVVLSCVVFSFFLLLISPPVVSQLTISPNIIELRSYPGGLETFTVSVGNTGDVPIVCTMRVSALNVLAAGLPVAVDDAPRSCKDWITLAPETFTLRPKDGKRVVCRVRPPRKTGGGYYAVISCDAVPQTRGEQEGGAGGAGAVITFTHRALAPVLLIVPAPDMRAIIEAARPILARSDRVPGYTLELPVRNRGNIHARMTGTAEVRSEAGQLVERFDLASGRGFILPDHERLFASRGAINLPDGLYVVRLTLEAQNSRQPMTNAFPFYVKEGLPTVAEITDELRAELNKLSAGFAVSPAQMQVVLRAGARRTQAAELVNLTRETIRLNAAVMEWYRSQDGRDLVSLEKPPHDRSGRSFVSLQEQEIELRPLSRQRVPLVVALPKGTTGERYAAVTFDRADVQLDRAPAARASRSTTIRVQEEATAAPAAQMTKFQAARTPNGTIEFTAQFKNTGNVGLVPDVSFSITDENGSAVGKVTPPGDPSFVQAGGEGTVSAEWSRVLDPGQYTGQLTFRFSPNKPPIIERAAFIVPELGKSSAGRARGG